MFSSMNLALLIGFLHGAWRRAVVEHAARSGSTRDRAMSRRRYSSCHWSWESPYCACSPASFRRLACRASKGIDQFLLPYVRDAARRVPPSPGQPVHVLLCVADHYEPQFGGADAELAAQRVERVGHATTRGSSAASATATAGRRGTRSSIPIEEYDPEHLDAPGRALPRRLRRGRDPPPPRRRHRRATSATAR